MILPFSVKGNGRICFRLIVRVNDTLKGPTHETNKREVNRGSVYANSLSCPSLVSTNSERSLIVKLIRVEDL